MTKDHSTELIPQHLAIIMDGNGRWAEERGLPRIAGHQAGMQVVSKITEICIEFGVQVLTLYTFSTENWLRPEEEVDFLMNLAEEYAKNELPDLQRNGIRLQLMGRREKIPAYLLSALDETINQTKGNSRLILNLAFNYGGRAEIVDAMKGIISNHQDGLLDATKIDELTFSQYLYCPGTPDIDLVLRTSGEWRLSNFCLWRSSSAVFVSLPVFWPDFQREHFMEAIKIYDKHFAK